MANREMNQLARTSAETKSRSLLIDTELFHIPKMALMSPLFVLQSIPADQDEKGQRKAASQQLMDDIAEKSTFLFTNLFIF